MKKSLFCYRFSNVLLVLSLILCQTRPSHAGVFNLHQFVDYESWAFGLEPETTLTSGGGFATNLKFTYGITPLSNFQLGLGFGGGARGFRVGGAYTFDIVPDLEAQAGFGIALQSYYYKLRGGLAQVEATVLPYLHNEFKTSSGFSFDPYLGLPIGMAFVSGTYRTIVQFALGSTFHISKHFDLNSELGLNLKDTDSYFAIGVTYRD